MEGQRRFRLASPNIVSETVDGESVILNLESGFYYGLNETGSWIWDALRDGLTEDRLATSLSRRWGLGAEAAITTVARFANRLADEQLLRETDAAPDASPDEAPSTAAGVPFTEPELTRYEDIQELLLIDPIHEVDEDGWPNRPGDSAAHGD